MAIDMDLVPNGGSANGHGTNGNGRAPGERIQVMVIGLGMVGIGEWCPRNRLFMKVVLRYHADPLAKRSSRRCSRSMSRASTSSEHAARNRW
jgi:hypothetical protein